MEHPSFVADFATVLCVAAVTAVLFRFLRQPAILGYLLAGLIVGPYIPFPMFADAERIGALSEFGVVLVMFAVGLEFSIRRMLRVLPLAGLTALVEVSAMLWIGLVLGSWLGLTPTAQLFLGASLAVSSTMVVARVFDERPMPDDLRRFVFSVLVLQDVAAIVLVATVTAVASGAGLDARGIFDTVTKLGAVLVGMVLFGLLVLVRGLRWLATHANAEIFTVATGGVCFGFAAAANGLGYSPALGAFLAGMLVAEAGVARRVERLVQPMRDLFAAVFFVSVGMTVDPRLAVDHIGTSVLVAVAVIVGQLGSVTVAGILSGVGTTRAVQAGLTLGQLGEFSFIIAGIGVAAKVVPDFVYPVVVTASVITAFTTPWAIRLGQRLAIGLEHRLPKRLRHALAMYEAWLAELRTGGSGAARRRLRRSITALAIDAVAIAALVIGTSAGLPRLAAWISERVEIGETPVLVTGACVAVIVSLPFLRGVVRASRNLGSLLGLAVFPVPEGGKLDMTVASRKLLTVALQLAAVMAVGAPVVAATQPFLPVGVGPVAFVAILVPLTMWLWRTAGDLGEHVRAGAAVVLEALTREPGTHEDPHSLEEFLHGLGHVVRHAVADGSPSIGRTLAELDLRARTGASVLAIARGTEGIVSPTGSETLRPGDVLALTGAPEAVSRARAALDEKPP